MLSVLILLPARTGNALRNKLSVKTRLDQAMAVRGLTTTRSQAESWIRMGKVRVNERIETKPGFLVRDTDTIVLAVEEQFVGRAALKLKSADEKLRLDFRDKTVLDVGSSTGGFTQYALKHGAAKVYAVDVGTNQLHPDLRGDPRIELHEKTDIRDFRPTGRVDMVVIDVSFISLREILPAIVKIAPAADVVAMVKPQFEARQSNIQHKGVIKNDRMRREVLKDFEAWVQKLYKIVAKTDSGVAGAKGNVERFYLLRSLKLG